MKNILIAEDEKAYSRALVLKLQHTGYEATSVENGEEAIAALKEGKFDLLLLDLIMPKMDGLAMLEKLRQDSWGKDVRVIMLTNLSGTEKIADAMMHNSFEYIVKTDTTIEDLVNKIKESL